MAMSRRLLLQSALTLFASLGLATGASTVGSGPELLHPLSVAADAANGLLVGDDGWNAVLRVDRATGDRSIVSGVGAGSGPDLRFPLGIVVEPAGTLVVLDISTTENAPRVVRIDRVSGDRVVLSDASSSGPVLSTPTGIAREPAGALVVSDHNRHAVLRVDPSTGTRETLSGCASNPLVHSCGGAVVGSGPEIIQPLGIAVEAAGMILVAQHHQLLRVDPDTGARTLVSDDASGAGPSLPATATLAIEASGDVLWASGSSVLRIDPVTGDRSTLSDPSTGTGPAPADLLGLIVEPSETVVAVDATLALVLAVDPGPGDRSIVSGGPLHTGPPLRCVFGATLESDGHLVVTDWCTPAVLRVNLETGHRSVISDATHGSGAALDAPLDVEVESTGALLVVQIPGRNLLRIDPVTGDRTVVASPNVGSGPDLWRPTAVAIEASGDILVGDDGRVTCLPVGPPLCSFGPKFLVRIDPDTGTRTLLSRGGAARVGSGRPFAPFADLAVAATGDIFVRSFQGAKPPRVRRVDPVNGNRTLVADNMFGGTGIAMESSGDIVATVDGVVRIDPLTKAVTRVSGAGVGAGPPFQGTSLIVVEPSGGLIVLDRHPAQLVNVDAVFRVDPVTGDRVYVSR